MPSAHTYAPIPNRAQRGRPPKRPPASSLPVDVSTGTRRVVRIQRHDSAVSITSGHLIARAETNALQIGGSVLVPIRSLRKVLSTLRQVAGRKG